MAVQYRERRKHLAKFKSQATSSTGVRWNAQSRSNVISESVGLEMLALSKKSKTSLKLQYNALRLWATNIQMKSGGGKTSLMMLLQQLSSVAVSKPVTLRRIVCRDGTVYPLRTEITVVVKQAVRNAEAFIQELTWLKSLSGKGISDEQAVAAFNESFHHLVKTHHRKPLHLQTEEDKRVNRVLDHLIDWRQFEIENPIEVPLWGRIGKRDDAGNLWVLWVNGPRGEVDEESVIHAPDVVGEFNEIGGGRWFYGTGRVFPDRIEWKVLPAAIPNPHDKDAIKAAWDLIPAHVMSEVAAWPLKERG